MTEYDEMAEHYEPRRVVRSVKKMEKILKIKRGEGGYLGSGFGWWEKDMWETCGDEVFPNRPRSEFDPYEWTDGQGHFYRREWTKEVAI